MDGSLGIALTVSGIGMVLLFLALAVLYGLMYLMTVITVGHGGGDESSVGPEGEARRRAAIIGVALARAEGEVVIAGAPAAENSLSPWQAYHRHRVLNTGRN